MCTYKRYEVVLHEQARQTCVGLIQCIKDWKSFIEPEEDFASVGTLSFGKNESDGVFEYWKPMALYIVSNDIKDIHDGDYVFVDCSQNEGGYKGMGVWKYQKAPCPMPYWGNNKCARKIIASTDKSLGLPEPPKGFVLKYIEEFNKGSQINTILVQQTYKAYLNWSGFVPLVSEIDNTLTIRKVKNNYTEHDISNALITFALSINTVDKQIHPENYVKAWIEENLIYPF